MANFTTHIAAGTLVAGGLATLTLAADVIAPENLVAVTLAGVLGSVLPDIDLRDSRPGRAMFAGLAVFFSFAVLFAFATHYSIVELWILWLGTLLFVRYGLRNAFKRWSVHRGVWHSLLAALFCAALTAIVFRYVLDRPDGVAWLAGGFMFVGYLVHLLLDEMYSVDVMDTHVKASFGTALKIYDRRYPAASAGMAVAAALAFWLAPSPKVFVEGVASRDLWAGLKERMLPRETWFGVLKVAGPLARPDGKPYDGLTTGSIPQSSLPAAPQSP